MVCSARLATLVLLLAAGSACGQLHALSEYYPDSGSDSATDTGDTGGQDSDTGVSDTDTGPVDTDTGPVDTGGDTLCENTCVYYSDGECDDGGPGADWALCALGTDCDDCGPRTGGGGTAGCTDDCPFYADGECDDGGPGSMWSICDLGTDCTDCGPR